MVTFDGGVTEAVVCQRHDRYRFVEADLGDQPRIARGGGYSYAAASFGGGSIVQDLRRFNRILRFDPEARTIEVEAGTTLAEVLEVTSRADLCLPVQPGYPAITIGGCIAANVHGKNPAREGTFVDCVADLTMFHPAYGLIRIGAGDSSGILELTCGGYGLTGVILAATLSLRPLTGHRVAVRRIRVSDLGESARLVEELSAENTFAYSWHDAVPRPRTFGRGFVFQGSMVGGSSPTGRVVPSYRPLTPEGRARLPFSFFGSLTSRALISAYWMAERSRPAMGETSVFDAMFPFARRSAYFRLFGRPGLAECQILVPSDDVSGFLRDVQHLLFSLRPPSLMMSLKAFRGRGRLLRFDGNGICVTLDLQRSPSTLDFLRRLDQLTVAAGGIPSIIKDSRLPASVVRACYPEYEQFRSRLQAMDPARLFRSELSNRLGL